jgi:predicted transcriptional regulator
MDSIHPAVYIDWTVELVASFLRSNPTSVAELPALISLTHRSLTTLAADAPQVPAVPVAESVQDEFIVCLEDGKRLKSLRRHLRQSFGMSLDEYRRKWRLPDDYPVVAPRYSRERSDIGRRRPHAGT